MHLDIYANKTLWPIAVKQETDRFIWIEERYGLDPLVCATKNLRGTRRRSLRHSSLPIKGIRLFHLNTFFFASLQLLAAISKVPHKVSFENETMKRSRDSCKNTRTQNDSHFPRSSKTIQRLHDLYHLSNKIFFYANLIIFTRNIPGFCSFP